MKWKILFALLLISSIGLSQKRLLNDRAIVAQHQRMVYEKWGDFYPNPKYKRIVFVKVQTNFAASTIWGHNLYGISFSNRTTRRNKKYKKGKDIRPLKATGLQNQRFGQRNIEKVLTDTIKKQTTEIKQKSTRDFMHWTSSIAAADPLYLIYYKKMLNQLSEFPKNPKNYQDWKLTDDRVYQRMLEKGIIEELQEELDLMKHNYNVAQKVDMPRGKRILLYHKTLIAWRKFENHLKGSDNTTRYYNKVYKSLQTSTHAQLQKDKSDVEIVRDIIEKYNN